MSEWAYRDCEKCGKKVHMNFKCDCGGNPWEIKDKKVIKHARGLFKNHTLCGKTIKLTQDKIDIIDDDKIDCRKCLDIIKICVDFNNKLNRQELNEKL